MRARARVRSKFKIKKEDCSPAVFASSFPFLLSTSYSCTVRLNFHQSFYSVLSSLVLCCSPEKQTSQKGTLVESARRAPLEKGKTWNG